jgi:dienelactone hydrolase
MHRFLRGAAAFVAVILFALPFPCSRAAAQGDLPDVGTKWFHVGADSVLVEYSPRWVYAPRPAVIVCPDRFGVRENTRSVLKVLARMGLAAYAAPLASAPARAPGGAPPAALDSSDVALLIELAAGVSQDQGCNGTVGLVGFDVGADAALAAAVRVPFFKACALFYPAGGDGTLATLPRVQAPVQLHLPQYAAGWSPDAPWREACVEAGRRVTLRLYKESRPFFFNPEHEWFDAKATQDAWNTLLQFLKHSL